LGHVLTAGHVVPENCSDLTIRGELAGERQPLSLKLVERSALDAALLQFVTPPSELVALSIGSPIENETTFNFKDVVILSFYKEFTSPTPTTARIDSVAVIGQPNLWALCAVAANRGRSGSPVMTAAGTVLAIFVEKPGDDSQDIARVLPINKIKDLSGLSAEPPIFSFKAVDWSASQIGPRSSVNLDLPLRDSEKYREHNLFYKPGRFIEEGGKFVSADQINSAEILAKGIGGTHIRYAVRKEQKFDAIEGYTFDPSVFILRVANMIPRASRRPDQPCADAKAWDCYEFSTDGRSLNVRYTLYVGHEWDHAGGRISSSITTRLRVAP
jgi:hypothetical protein